MRILLIDPPYERLIGFRSEWFPLGPAYLASFLSEKGFREIGIYHAEHSPDTEYKSIVKYAENFRNYKDAIASASHPVWKEVGETVSSFRPDVVGLSVLTPKVPAALRIAKIVKGMDHKIKIICGGYHPTISANEMLSNENIDFVIRGEGEESFYKLILALQAGSANYSDIEGLSFKEGIGIVHNRRGGYIKDLDAIPLPAREKLFNIETYSPVQLSMVMTSRGCPYGCGFCASGTMWQRTVRYRSIGNVLDEIRELKSKYGVRNIAFLDDAFTINRGRVLELCQAMIEQKIDITWSSLTRVNMISDDMVAIMKKAGCTKMDIGIESGNQRVLDLIGKRITLEEARKAANILRKNKMYWSAFFMFGFPTETEEEVEDTLRFLKEIKPDWANMSIFTPYLGTDLYDLAKKRGMICEPIDYTNYSHQNPYARFTDTISMERFSVLAKSVLEEVHNYNSSCASLLKRVFTRKYHKNPKLLYHDLKKAASWLGK